MSTTLHFLTQSRYEGSWNASTKSMDGFGTYTYPNGETYVGYFKDGRFHGFGTLKLLHPQKRVVKGLWDKGRCTTIFELHFADGLEFFGKFNRDGTVDANRWEYCSTFDRLFFSEERMGMQCPGPRAYLTANGGERSIPIGTYDTGYGFYAPRTGFITYKEATGELQQQRFVECLQEREFIEQNFRHKRNDEVPCNPKPDLKPEIWRQTIECNISAMCHRYEAPQCKCDKKDKEDRYFPYLKKQKSVNTRPNKANIEEDQSACDILHQASSSNTAQSLCDVSSSTSKSSQSFGHEDAERTRQISTADFSVLERKNQESEDNQFIHAISAYHLKEGMINITRF